MRPHLKIAMSTLFLALCFLFAPRQASAQAVSYMDGSGNIHFADSIDQVPKQYWSQIIKAKPTRISKDDYRRQVQEFNRKKQEEDQHKREEKRTKDREEQQRRTKLQQQQVRPTPGGNGPGTGNGIFAPTPIPASEPTPVTR